MEASGGNHLDPVDPFQQKRDADADEKDWPDPTHRKRPEHRIGDESVLPTKGTGRKKQIPRSIFGCFPENSLKAGTDLNPLIL